MELEPGIRTGNYKKAQATTEKVPYVMRWENLPRSKAEYRINVFRTKYAHKLKRSRLQTLIKTA
jgi:hypothetical protein